jgi:phospho-N-acetylmuramoyl-pentapeptide-transferase
LDDWQGIRGKRKGQGLRIRTKLLAQVLLATVIACVLKFLLKVPDLYLPGVMGEITVSAWIYIPVAAFIIVGASNAVNFTDGLDGLAGLISAAIFASYGVIALMQGQVFVSRFCFTLVGALFGFLWFNVHPAQLFMGDTGSLALGAAIAVVALMTGQWALLPIIAIIPVSEAVADILQIGYFRLTKGKRLFKMAPLHLHFELLGWSETQIVQRFWLISLIGAMLGIGLAMV